MSQTEETESASAESATAPVDLAAALGAAYDKATQEAEAPPSEESKPSEGDRARDDRGRFAQKAEKSEAQPAEAAAPEPAEPAIEAPASWAAEKRAAWSTLPPDVRKYIAEREAEAHRQISTQGQEVSRYRELAEALQPYQQAFHLSGTNPAAAIRQLLETQALLQRDPVNGLRWIAQQYGVTPDQLTQIAPQAPQDPHVQALMSEVRELRQFTAAQQAQQQAALRTSLDGEIQTFSKDKPHFEVVREHMGHLIGSGAAPDLATAYDQAVWANPTTRALLIEEQRRAAAAEVEKQRQAESAKRASAVNVRGSGAPVESAPRDWRETLAKSYDSATAA